ncbi:DgyrCDS3748 [Dimorphilus gyrociliatus]|uniref:DgyrCDS3748 n=1 Tax=Dimorphilus gyrociliatus TaxID=2664684 RepID=A0A7I8VEA8_9ANNE|nr:DgyrCDS3748 [Dimorphilus gyrociliatus]
MAKYDLKALPIGYEVHGINLKNELPADIVDQIRKDTIKHKILVFKNQGVILPQRQLQITRWFGDIEELGIEEHARVKGCTGVLRVSNDELEGLRGFGTSGFHIDGGFLHNPCANSIYHIVSCPKAGKTVFIDLAKIIENLAQEMLLRWERLWPVWTYKQILGSCNSGPTVVAHPLIYPHPLTSQPTLAIAMGKIKRFIWDMGTATERKATREESTSILKEIQNELDKNVQYAHAWESGDFIITDNLAVGHYADADTQMTKEEVGLRVMHRTCVRGKFVPFKNDCIPIEPSITAPNSEELPSLTDLELNLPDDVVKDIENRIEEIKKEELPIKD